MTEIMEMVNGYIETGMDMVRAFSVKEVALFKFAAITFGMLLAIYHHKTLKKLAPVIWLLFIASYAYLIGNYIFYLNAKKESLH